MSIRMNIDVIIITVVIISLRSFTETTVIRIQMLSNSVISPLVKSINYFMQ